MNVHAAARGYLHAVRAFIARQEANITGAANIALAGRDTGRKDRPDRL